MLSTQEILSALSEEAVRNIRSMAKFAATWIANQTLPNRADLFEQAALPFFEGIEEAFRRAGVAEPGPTYARRVFEKLVREQWRHIVINVAEPSFADH